MYEGSNSSNREAFKVSFTLGNTTCSRYINCKVDGMMSLYRDYVIDVK